MEVLREHRWINDEPKIAKCLSYGRDRVLPSKVIAEFCSYDTPTVTSVWVSFHESEHETEPIDESLPYVYDDSPLRWVASHSEMLFKSYQEQWILVGKGQEGVLGSSTNPQDLFAIADARGIESPFITRVARPQPLKAKVYGTCF